MPILTEIVHGKVSIIHEGSYQSCMEEKKRADKRNKFKHEVRSCKQAIQNKPQLKP